MIGSLNLADPYPAPNDLYLDLNYPYPKWSDFQPDPNNLYPGLDYPYTDLDYPYTELNHNKPDLTIRNRPTLSVMTIKCI